MNIFICRTYIFFFLSVACGNCLSLQNDGNIRFFTGGQGADDR